MVLRREIDANRVDHGAFETPWGAVQVWVADDSLRRDSIDHNRRAIDLCRDHGFEPRAHPPGDHRERGVARRVIGDDEEPVVRAARVRGAGPAEHMIEAVSVEALAHWNVSGASSPGNASTFPCPIRCCYC